MEKKTFHRLEIDERKNAVLSMDAAYVPVVGQKEYVLLSHYIDLLNSLATQQDLESFEATVHLYGYFS
ncbi:MAG: hypothetical protein C4520_03120, partial [Candidatus Abyssobacteria bacterium SURF_5]